DGAAGKILFGGEQKRGRIRYDEHVGVEPDDLRSTDEILSQLGRKPLVHIRIPIPGTMEISIEIPCPEVLQSPQRRSRERWPVAWRHHENRRLRQTACEAADALDRYDELPLEITRLDTEHKGRGLPRHRPEALLCHRRVYRRQVRRLNPCPASKFCKPR